MNALWSYTSYMYNSIYTETFPDSHSYACVYVSHAIMSISAGMQAASQYKMHLLRMTYGMHVHKKCARTRAS
jgi:cyclopropane fatty-acyl-phospholipid synthase-like methyltransferase